VFKQSCHIVWVVWQQADEENVRSQGGWSDGGLEKLREK
jgi:hypothetical protein